MWRRRWSAFVWCLSWISGVLSSDDISFTPQLMFEWDSLDYEWPNETTKENYIANGKFIKENNIITGIKLYKTDVYVTVPRWRDGVPSTLNRVVQVGTRSVLRPFPDWGWQELGNCDALQYVQSMEVDPNTGWMWIIDTGRVNTAPLKESSPQNLCPAKLLVYDLRHKRVVRRYTFPATVVSPTTNFLNDIVVDDVDGRQRYAYITDTSRDNPGLVVYDYHNNTSHRFTHVLAMTSKADAENITINNITYVFTGPIDGIALSPDSRYVYFCPLSAYSLYQVSTAVVRDPLADFGAAVHKVGRKMSQSDGMIYGQKNLYFGALGLNGVYKWEIARDAENIQTYEKIEMKTQTRVTVNDMGMQWVDTLAFDQHGYLWFTANRLQRFVQGTLDMSVNAMSSNFRIWKVYVGEKGYIDHSSSKAGAIVFHPIVLMVTAVCILL